MPFVRRLTFPLFLLLILFYAIRPLEGGDDFWAHAAIGRIVLDTGHIPKSTVYLWSADVPWVFHAYGSGVIYALLLRLGGPGLCLALNFVLAATPFALIWCRAKARAGEVPSVLVVLLVWAVYLSQIRWRLRPEGFTIAFLIVLLLFLTAQHRPKWSYFAIAGMFALWPNLHGGVLIGILVIWIGAVCHLFDWNRQPPLVSAGPLAFSGQPDAPAPSDPDALKSSGAPTSQPDAPVETARRRPSLWPLFGLAIACSVLPLLCNPWGLGYIRVFAGTEATAKHISEWRPFWTFPHMSRVFSWGLCGLWVVTLAVWLLDARRRATTLGALLLVGALWLQARRQLWITGATCAFALAQSAFVLRGDTLYSRLKRAVVRMDDPMHWIGQIGALFVLLAACYTARPRGPVQTVAPTAPVAMSRFLLTQAPKGRLFNDYEYSAALEWFLNGHRPLYIDLINAYPPELFDEWFEVAHASPEGLKVLNQKKIDVVALRPVSPNNTDDPIWKLLGYLDKSPDWKLIYQARDGKVWARKKPFLQAIAR